MGRGSIPLLCKAFALRRAVLTSVDLISGGICCPKGDGGPERGVGIIPWAILLIHDVMSVFDIGFAASRPRRVWTPRTESTWRSCRRRTEC